MSLYINNQEFTTISGYLEALINTGYFLQVSTNSLSGNMESQKNTISGYNTEQYTTAATGSALQSQINTMSNFSKVSALRVTGFSSQTGIINISGLGNVTVFTGVNNSIIISGAASQGTISNSDGINLSGNLTTTGQTIYSYIVGLSGVLNSSGIQYQSQINTLTTNLTTTGQTLISNYSSLSGNVGATGSILYNLINNFSGVFNSSGTQYQSQLNTHTTNIQSTGQTLYNLLVNESGLISSVRVTGSSIITNPNLFNSGNISIIYSGSNIIISGASSVTGEINTASNIASSGIGIFAQKAGSDLQFNTLFGGTGIIVSRSGNAVLFNQRSPMIIPFVASNVTWTNMPVALNFLNASAGYRMLVDLSGYSQVNLMSTIVTAGTVTGYIALRYFNNDSTTVTQYVSMDVDNTVLKLGQARVATSGWHDLVPGTKSGVYVALIGISGSAAVSPVFGLTYAQFR